MYRSSFYYYHHHHHHHHHHYYYYYYRLLLLHPSPFLSFLPIFLNSSSSSFSSSLYSSFLYLMFSTSSSRPRLSLFSSPLTFRWFSFHLSLSLRDARVYSCLNSFFSFVASSFNAFAIPPSPSVLPSSSFSPLLVPSSFSASSFPSSSFSSFSSFPSSFSSFSSFSPFSLSVKRRSMIYSFGFRPFCFSSSSLSSYSSCNQLPSFQRSSLTFSSSSLLSSSFHLYPPPSRPSSSSSSSSLSLFLSPSFLCNLAAVDRQEQHLHRFFSSLCVSFRFLGHRQRLPFYPEEEGRLRRFYRSVAAGVNSLGGAGGDEEEGRRGGGTIRPDFEEMEEEDGKGEKGGRRRREGNNSSSSSGDRSSEKKGSEKGRSAKERKKREGKKKKEEEGEGEGEKRFKDKAGKEEEKTNDDGFGKHFGISDRERIAEKMHSLYENDPDGMEDVFDDLDDKTIEKICREIRRRELANTVKVPPIEQLKLLAISSCIPFIGFGFVDNFVMIVAGDLFDTTLCVILGFSTMAAAALGNLISDLMGISLGGYIERVAHLVGFAQPSMTRQQMEAPRSRLWYHGGSAVGVAIGCTLGMAPLLLIDTQEAERLKRRKAQEELFGNVMEEMAGYLQAEKVVLYMVDLTNKEFHTTVKGEELRLPLINWRTSHTEESTFKQESTTTCFPKTEPQEIAKEVQAKQILGAPIFGVTGKIIGVVEVVNPVDKEFFTRRDKEFLIAICSHLALEVEGKQHITNILEMCRKQIAARGRKQKKNSPPSEEVAPSTDVANSPWEVTN